MKKKGQAIPNLLLRKARTQQYWTQSQVAEKLGTTVVNVSRWESGMIIPSLYFRQKLCELFGKTAQELGLIPEAEKQEQLVAVASPSHPVLWNIPFRRNHYFTGRQDVLAHLEAVLQKEQTAAIAQPKAISGLGGIGKTQTAVEYAYRHQDSYQAILWAKADSHDLLTADFVSLASVLDLPEKDEQDQSQAVEAVKRWLKDYTDWLLILDNVEDLEQVSNFLPEESRGHVLLTTRAQSLGALAQRIELDKLTPEEGALLLLRRAKLLGANAGFEQTSPAQWAKALELTELLDGLPLALDQAAAYIEETDCGLSGYLERYQSRRAKLLHLRGGAAPDHPDPVATTWSLSFEKVQQANPVAADLLRLCAFLHPDAIPEEIIIEGATELGPVLVSMAGDPLELDAAIRELRKYSLIRRDPEAHLLQVHRLVQVVLQDTLEEKERHMWAERSMLAINAVFPHAEYGTWSQCERLLPQALGATERMEQYQVREQKVSRLLFETAAYLQDRARYTEAEPLYRRSLAIREQFLGSDHPDVASSLNGLAKLYHLKGKYDQAEPLFQRALHIWEQQSDPDHSDVAYTLNNLAELYREQGKYEQAVPLFQQALHIWEQQLGPDHPDIASSLNNLASLYSQQGKYAQAEPLFQRALHIREQRLGSDHPDVATSLHNLACLYYEQGKLGQDQGKYEQAVPLFYRALHIWEQQLGADHPDVAYPLTNLAGLYLQQSKYGQAEPLYQRALHIWEQQLGSEHLQVAYPLHGLAELYFKQGKYEQAEPLFQRSVHIFEQLGPDHPQVAYPLYGLAELYFKQGKYEQAVPLFYRALHIFEQLFGPDHRKIATWLNKLASLYLEQGKYAQAEPLLQRALHIRELQLGPEHPDTAQIIYDLALLWEAQNNGEEASLWYARALAAYHQSLGAQHSKTVETRKRFIALLHIMGRHEEAAQLEAAQADQAADEQ